MPEMNYELAPRQGQLASQRNQELHSARFVAVRNLAYMVYKKPDGQPLMTYQETLEDRERVMQTIVMHEVGLGYLQNDLGVGAPAGAPTGQMVPTGAPAPGMMAAAPMGQAAPGYQTPPPNGAPPVGQGMMVPAAAYAAPGAQMAPVQPQQAQAPAQQEAPAASQPTGRKRRGAAGGAAVAPPAGAPTQQPLPGPGMMAPAGAPAPGFTPVGVGQPQYQQPVTQQINTGVGVQHPPAGQVGPLPTGTPIGTVDTQAVLQALQSIGAELGRGLSAISADIEQLKQRVGGIEQLSGKTHVDTLQAIAALHHIYGSLPNLAQLLQQERVSSLDDFRRYLTPKYTGNP